MDSLQNRSVELLASAVNGPTSLSQVSWLLTNWDTIISSTKTPVELELSQLGTIVYAAAIIRVSKSEDNGSWSDAAQLRAARRTLLKDVAPSTKMHAAARSLGKRIVKPKAKKRKAITRR